MGDVAVQVCIAKVWGNYNKHGRHGLPWRQTVVGALMVNAVGGCRKKIVSYMTFSATFWAIVITHSASFAIHSLW